MDVGLLFALGFGWLIVLFGVTQFGRLWSGELLELTDQGTESWFPFGESLRRGFVRGSVAGLVVSIGVFSSATAYAVADAVSGRWASGLRAVGLAGAVVLLVGLLLFAGVVLVNRPRWIVPPPVRHEPGAIRMGRGGRRAERR